MCMIRFILQIDSGMNDIGRRKESIVAFASLGATSGLPKSKPAQMVLFVFYRHNRMTVSTCRVLGNRSTGCTHSAR